MKNKYLYKWLALAVLFALHFGANAQQAWRPFRPGLIYSFSPTSSSASNGTANVFLLRLDSTYRTAGGDSVWAFNRLMRPFDGSALGGMFAFTTARKSRNNLFGARLVWQPGTAEFILENVAEGSQQAALSLRLRPRAAVGSSWVASTAPALTATLTSRSWDRVGSQPGSPFDSVAVITLSSGAVVRLGRQYGLLAGPRWLTLTSTAPQYGIRELPVALAGSPLSPDRLFDLHPGDLLGYETTPQSVGGPPCTSTYTLRNMLTRQVVGDSLIFTYRQQSKVVNHSISGCFGTPPGTVLGPVQTGRLAFSLRTGQSPQYEALPLLSGEYRELSRFAGSVVLVGLGLSQPTFPTCQSGNTILGYEYLHRSGMASNNTLAYGTITDGNWFQHFAAETGLGDIRTDEKTLQYSVKSGFAGPIICGSNTNYATLLPTRAAQAAAIATLHPNPAPEAATLTLAQPARPGSALRLTDALGRAVWSAPMPAGQSAISIPLAGQPAGLYLLHLSGPDGATATWKLTHE